MWTASLILTGGFVKWTVSELCGSNSCDSFIVYNGMRAEVITAIINSTEIFNI